MEKKIRIIERGREWRQKWAFSNIDIEAITHPVDQKLIAILNTAHTKALLESPLEQLVAAQYGQLLSTGIPVDEEIFPDVYILLQNAAQRLGIPVPYTVITNSLSGVNAFATGTDRKPFIVISNTALKVLTPGEQQFILGHECGHIAMQHMVYHTAVSLAAVLGGYLPVVGPLLANTISLPLNTWNRCSEITADRIGLLCCEDLTTAQRALLKIVGGAAEMKQVNIDHYIDKCRMLQNKMPLGKLGEYLKSHPILFKRLKALELFSHSLPFYEARRLHPPKCVELLSKQELDRKTNALLSVL